jgi:predicted nucleic acid-binding Zn ribbon protein
MLSVPGLPWDGESQPQPPATRLHRATPPVDVQMRFVRERLVALEARIGDERQEVDQRIDRVQTAAQESDARSQTAITEVEAKVREVATGSPAHKSVTA